MIAYPQVGIRFSKRNSRTAAGIPEYWRVERSADDPDDAVILKHRIARTADGTAAYIETGVTTLAALEGDTAR